jgi:hypothetical protein
MLWDFYYNNYDMLASIVGSNGTERFKQLFECLHLLFIRDTGVQSSNLYLSIVHFFNAGVN